MCRYGLITLCLAGWLIAGVQAAPPRVSQRWALLIGVDDYANANRLSYCGADQVAMRERLLSAGFPADHIFLLHDKAEENKFRPSKGNIERQLNNVLKLADSEDLVVIGFSGHGVYLDSKSYLCPNDAVLNNPETLVELEGIYEQLQRCSASLKLVLVDACRNDPRRGGQRALAATEETRQLARSLQEAHLPEGVVLLNSCSPGEISYEESRFNHGVFMQYVLEALGGEADSSGDGLVSLDELRRYVGPKTKAYVAQKFNDIQRPFITGALTEEAMDYALFSVRRLPLTTTPSLPMPTPIPLASNPGPVKPGAVVTNSLGMKFLQIPAGEFEMGCEEDALSLLRRFPDTKPEQIADERPLHRVRISQSFYLGIHEVTLGQFLQFYHDAKYQVECERDGKGGWGYISKSKGFVQASRFVPWSWGFEGQTMDHPVVNVTWNDCVAFCEWLTKKEGVTYRLPTEAEWEYACKAGSKSRYWFGNDAEELVQHENTCGREYRGLFDNPDTATTPYKDGSVEIGLRTLQGRDPYVFTAPVGSFRPNPFGLYDMLGNVFEWCHDRYDAHYYDRSLSVDPRGPDIGTERVRRGGSWRHAPVYCRSAFRRSSTPDDRYCFLGFRLVRGPFPGQ